MVVLLVFLTFAVCVLADWLVRRRESGRSVQDYNLPVLPPAPLERPLYVGGFRVQPEFAYHPGHAWLRREGRDSARLGMDDFGIRLLGKVDALTLPEVGSRVGQGQPAIVFTKGDRQVAALSPVSGRVVAVNQQALRDPGRLADDPYWTGWLMVVRSSELTACLNNLLSGDLVRRWVEDISARLRSFMPGGVAYSFPDGGVAVDDISSVVAGPTWEQMVEELLLTRPQSPR